MTIQGSRVLVTGGAGFIGSHLVAALAPANQVTVVDDFSTGKLENLHGAPCDLVRADVADPGIARSFAGVEIVFHLAAQVSVDLSVQDPVADARANVLGTLNVLECARRAGVRRVVISSSSAVYGAADRIPTSCYVPRCAAQMTAGPVQDGHRLGGLWGIPVPRSTSSPNDSSSSSPGGTISTVATVFRNSAGMSHSR